MSGSLPNQWYLDLEVTEKIRFSEKGFSFCFHLKNLLFRVPRVYWNIAVRMEKLIRTADHPQIFAVLVVGAVLEFVCK